MYTCVKLFLLLFQCPLTPRAAQIHQEAKTARTMVLVLGLHMVSLIPYLIVVTMRYANEGREDVEAALSDAKKVKQSINIALYCTLTYIKSCSKY